MEPIQAIVNNISRFITLTPDEEEYFTSILKIIKVRKKQAVCQPGFICRHRTFIVQGAMRAYIVDSDGQEHTITLAIEDWWISDFSSYIFQQTATQFVEAMEDSVLVQIEYHAEEALLAKYPQFEKYFRILSQRALAFLQTRVLCTLSTTAEERYEAFVKNYPQIVSRTPQYALASYLGITTEFLSKIRNGKLKKDLPAKEK
jgi:CRP-like cAMP-binding protein